MTRAAVALALLLAAAASRAADDEPMWRPAPAAEWPSDLDLSLVRPVVVVGADFPGARQRGNGVVVDGDAGGRTAWILTCAHVVERDGHPASQVRVGLLAHTFVSPAATPYVEGVASVVTVSRTKDLALLAVDVSSPLHAADVGSVELPPGLLPASVVSLVPFDRPTIDAPGRHHTYRPGQSGSPRFEGHRVVGLARAMIGGHLAVEVHGDEIFELLAGLPAGQALVARWRRLEAPFGR